MKRLNRYTLVAAKVLEVLHWFGVAAVAVLLVLSFAAPDTAGWLFSGLPKDLNVYGFEVGISGAEGALSLPAVRLALAVAIPILSLMAMVFRNVYLIFQTAEEKTWFSTGKTPFQKDVVRMVREIGIFYASIPVLGLILSIIGRLTFQATPAEFSVNLSGIVTGVLMLCLSQVFAYGMALQADVDGLL